MAYFVVGLKMADRKKDYAHGAGNVFADLAVSGSEEALAKAKLAHKIIVLIQERKLTQVRAAKLLRIDQPKVSALFRGRLTGFSMERLVRFLLLLGQDIKITVQPAPRSRPKPHISVS